MYTFNFEIREKVTSEHIIEGTLIVSYEFNRNIEFEIEVCCVVMYDNLIKHSNEVVNKSKYSLLEFLNDAELSITILDNSGKLPVDWTNSYIKHVQTFSKNHKIVLTLTEVCIIKQVEKDSIENYLEIRLPSFVSKCFSSFLNLENGKLSFRAEWTKFGIGDISYYFSRVPENEVIMTDIDIKMKLYPILKLEYPHTINYVDVMENMNLFCLLLSMSFGQHITYDKLTYFENNKVVTIYKTYQGDSVWEYNLPWIPDSYLKYQLACVIYQVIQLSLSKNDLKIISSIIENFVIAVKGKGKSMIALLLMCIEEFGYLNSNITNEGMFKKLTALKNNGQICNWDDYGLTTDYKQNPIPDNIIKCRNALFHGNDISPFISDHFKIKLMAFVYDSILEFFSVQNNNSGLNYLKIKKII